MIKAILFTLVVLQASCLSLRHQGSWDSYIDHLIGQSSGATDKAAIIGIDDGSKWTTDNHANSLKISNAEAQVIAKAMKSGDYSGFQMGGINAEGVKYQFLRG